MLNCESCPPLTTTFRVWVAGRVGGFMRIRHSTYHFMTYTSVGHWEKLIDSDFAPFFEDLVLLSTEIFPPLTTLAAMACLLLCFRVLEGCMVFKCSTLYNLIVAEGPKIGGSQNRLWPHSYFEKQTQYMSLYDPNYQTQYTCHL